MLSIRNMPVALKISAAAGVLTAVAVIAMAWIAIARSSHAMRGMVDSHLTSSVEKLAQITGSEVARIRAETNRAVGALDAGLAARSGAGADWNLAVRAAAESQQVGSFTIRPLEINGLLFTDTLDIVDRALEETGLHCTIFQVVPEGLLRVATTIPNAQGSRAIGTVIAPDSPLYKTVMRGESFRGKAIILGKDYVTLYTPVADASGEIVAVLFSGQLLSENPGLMEVYDNTRFGESGFAYAIDEDGVIRLHPTLTGQSGAEMPHIAHMLETRSGLTRFGDAGEQRLVAYAPVEDIGWIVAASASVSESTASIAALARTLIVGCLVLATLAAIISWGLGRAVSGGINRVSRAINEIARGDGDLTARLPDLGRDEVGRLAEGFNLFAGHIHDLIVQVAGEARGVIDAANQIASAANQSAAGAQLQSARVREMQAALDELATTVDTVAEQTRRASENARESGEFATAGGDTVARTIDSLGQIRETVSGASEVVRRLGSRVQEIGGITELINDIAEQTNLLALNAAIEAARAGEHGRGFAVVADEVRKLADRTTKATEQINEAIRATQSDTEASVHRIGQGVDQVGAGVELAGHAGQALERIVNSAAGVNGMFEYIAAATEEQSATARALTESVGAVAQTTQETSDSAQRTSSAASDLRRGADGLMALVGRFRVNEQASSIHR